MAAASRHAKGRLVSVLEGGYDLEGLSLSAAAHVQNLMGED
jgi:acetoin utilization deacetylase AcuC-like enzyme